MRDTTYDKRAVPLPNVTLTGFGRGSAKPGDMITYNEWYKIRSLFSNSADGDSAEGDYARTRIARVLGRIKHAPAINKWLIVLALSEDGLSSYIRWIDPKHVTKCVRPSDMDHLMQFAEMFYSIKFPFTIEETIRLCDHGTMSAIFYDESHARDVIDGDHTLPSERITQSARIAPRTT